MSRTVVGGVVIEKLPAGCHNKCGTWQGVEGTFSSQWRPLKAYTLPGSFIHCASHNKWRGVYLRHFYSFKYAGKLARHRPDLYIQLHGIPEADIRAQLLFKNHIALKLRGEL